MSSDRPAMIGFMTEKKSGLGEDAEPITQYVREMNADVVGVFDGMGGAGATQVPAENEKDKCSMAFLASRSAREEIVKVLCQWGKDDLTGLNLSIESAVVSRLVKLTERKDGKGPEARLRGTILADYPTTVALAIVQNSKDEHSTRKVKVLWAGDSRVYSLDPNMLVPLQRLTQDHTEPGGGGDAALQRYASAGGLNLETRDFDLPPESAVIAMTDGCYGYMSPFQLMYTLVSQIVRSRDEDEWKVRIRAKISGVAGDDTSLAISFGEGGFTRLKQSLEPRLEQMEPIAFVVETDPSNPLIVPHNEGFYFEFLDAQRKKAEPSTLDVLSLSSEPTGSESEPPIEGVPLESPADSATETAPLKFEDSQPPMAAAPLPDPTISGT